MLSVKLNTLLLLVLIGISCREQYPNITSFFSVISSHFVWSYCINVQRTYINTNLS